LLKSAEADVGMEMMMISVPTQQYVAELPKEVAKPQCKREYKDIERI
jgi:hypothetical protein